jgi:hypothetical protein
MMSRHHILPPIIYVPQPRPKKLEPRRGRIQLRAAGAIAGTDDVEEVDDLNGLGHATSAANKPPLEPIFGAERKPSGTGLLSEDTLQVLLLAQEYVK